MPDPDRPRAVLARSLAAALAVVVAVRLLVAAGLVGPPGPPPATCRCDRRCGRG